MKRNKAAAAGKKTACPSKRSWSRETISIGSRSVCEVLVACGDSLGPGWPEQLNHVVQGNSLEKFRPDGAQLWAQKNVAIFRIVSPLTRKLLFVIIGEHVLAKVASHTGTAEGHGFS